MINALFYRCFGLACLGASVLRDFVRNRDWQSNNFTQLYDECFHFHSFTVNDALIPRGDDVEIFRFGKQVLPINFCTFHFFRPIWSLQNSHVHVKEQVFESVRIWCYLWFLLSLSFSIIGFGVSKEILPDITQWTDQQKIRFLEIAYFQKHGLQHVVLLARQDKRGDCLPMIIDHRSCFGYLKSAFKLV